jgi:hypothetical protein
LWKIILVLFFGQANKDLESSNYPFPVLWHIAGATLLEKFGVYCELNLFENKN